MIVWTEWVNDKPIIQDACHLLGFYLSCRPARRKPLKAVYGWIGQRHNYVGSYVVTMKADKGGDAELEYGDAQSTLIDIDYRGDRNLFLEQRCLELARSKKVKYCLLRSEDWNSLASLELNRIICSAMVRLLARAPEENCTPQMTQALTMMQLFI